jgi:hypothetical protein
MSINRISKVVLAAGLLGPASLPLRAATISAVSFPDSIGPAFFTNHWGFAQGVAMDSSNVYHFFTTALSKQGYTNLTTLLSATGNSAPFAGMTNDYNHLGAGCCYGGNLYVAAEMYHGCGNATNASIAVFDAQSLALKSMNLVSNYQSEISAVAISPDGVVYTTDFCDGSRLFKYDLNFNYLGPVILSTNIPCIQGITCYNNLLLVIADAGASGNLWVVDPASGHCSLLANLQVAGNTEWEGIAVFNGTILACEGATGSLLYYTLSAPAITSEPQPLSVTDGSPAILSVIVNGESPMTHQHHPHQYQPDLSGCFFHRPARSQVPGHARPLVHSGRGAIRTVSRFQLFLSRLSVPQCLRGASTFASLCVLRVSAFELVARRNPQAHFCRYRGLSPALSPLFALRSSI